MALSCALGSQERKETAPPQRLMEARWTEGRRKAQGSWPQEVWVYQDNRRLRSSSQDKAEGTELFPQMPVFLGCHDLTPWRAEPAD